MQLCGQLAFAAWAKPIRLGPYLQPVFQGGNPMPRLAAIPRNYWPDNACARAFWRQQELPAYQALLADTLAWAEPQPGQRWLDLGCGCGQLAQGLWRKSAGAVAEIVGLDCAAANRRAFDAWCAAAEPQPAPGQVRFVASNFSDGLPDWPDGYFDGIISGLAIQYAESFSEEQGCWTTAAYERLLTEVRRVLRPGGALVFSVNVPEPSWARVGLHSLSAFWRSPRRMALMKNAWRMARYGAWLKREARRGRFHYLPWPVLAGKLAAAGLDVANHRLSYAGQAYLVRCHSPA
jgi:ubiquinone/menaquinone biosynthesis C-methylase UbiE